MADMVAHSPSGRRESSNMTRQSLRTPHPAAIRQHAFTAADADATSKLSRCRGNTRKTHKSARCSPALAKRSVHKHVG